MAPVPPAAWLVLVHQLPPRPLYLRAKIRQRLAKVGALALKNAVYVLPDSEDAREDFAWIAQEARAGGGDAIVCTASFVEGVSPRELVERFRRERDADYDAVLAGLKAAAGPGRKGRRATDLGRATKRFAEIRAIDFFEASRRKEVEAMLHARERTLHRHDHPAARGAVRLRGRVWVTRRGVKVDRIASAWLVRRFVDPAARFRFVDPERTERRPGELRFDMEGGDFTHEGDRCTFETLLARVGLKDSALAPIAEIVHDIDLKDDKFGRPDAAGVRRLVEGVVATHASDAERLERGFALFDDLYASFRGPTPPKKTRKRRG